MLPLSAVIPDFPVSVPAMVTWVLLLVVAGLAFVQLLLHLNRKGRRQALALIFTILLLAATAVHVLLLSRSHHTVTDGNWVQLVLVSLVAGLEMFIGHTVVFDDIIAAVIFREPLLMIAYLTVFVLILLFTLSMVIFVMPRRLRDRTWLRMNRSQAGRKQKNHVFLGVSPYSKLLARSILQERARGESKLQGDIIFIDFPTSEGHHAELSIGELISNIFGRKKELTLEEELGSDRFVLLGGHLPSGESTSLASSIGLAKLDAWLENPRTSLYILGEKEQDNFELMKAFTRDSSIQAKAFFYAKEPDGFYSLAAGIGKRLRILDPHYLSFMQVKLNRPELYPIRYVDIACDKEGQPLGYANKGLHALIVGFGAAGQEALRFLYEFGAFVGKDLERAPMSITILEQDMDRQKGKFLSKAPALREDGNLHWKEMVAGSESFWTVYDQLLAEGLRYVVVCVDKGNENVSLAVQLLERAAQKGVDLSRFVILVRTCKADTYTDGLLSYYNHSFAPEGREVLTAYGRSETVWEPDIISGRSLKRTAIRFSSAFQQSEGWEERHRRLTQATGNALSNHRELMRRQAQDLSLALYSRTLLQMAGPSLKEAAQDIPDDYEKEHYPQKDATYAKLECLAASEHEHWRAFMQVNGYTDGPVDELLQTHPDMAPYSAIQDEKKRHISWLSIRTSLTMEE